jgi:divalent metal cation (Fe/Co/Zn/Cd) transporter
VTLTLLAWISLAIAFASAVAILLDEIRHPQKMVIMNVVWPISALYFSLFAVWAYFRIGRTQTQHAMADGMSKGNRNSDRPPTPAEVAVGTSHCGAGCTVADVFTEFGIAASGLTLFGSVLWTGYLLDFLVAWMVGIAFQYFAIKPMRDDLSRAKAIWVAIKADTLSITAFQVGMYAWMALVFFKLFPAPHLTPFDPRYWLMMQIAMLCGFATSYPMNRFLIGIGLKERM